MKSIYRFKWILSAIKHGMNENNIVFDSVINSEGETFRKEPIFIKMNTVYSHINLKGVNIRKKRINKISAKTFLLLLVKSVALE